MQEVQIFGLLAPIISFLIAMNFFVFWSQQHEARHILAFAIAFFLCACSILISHHLIAGLSYANITIAIALDTCSLGLVIWGSCERVKKETPYGLILATGLVGLVIGTLLIMQSNAALPRLAVLHGVHAVLLFICGWHWSQAGSNSKSQRVVSVMFFMLSLASIAFPLSMFGLQNQLLADQYQHSAHWALYNFMIAISVMIAGLSLISILTDDMLKMIKAASNTDLLTGLKTRRAFEEELDNIFYKLERSPLPLSMIIADIDHFKLVNDTYGHQAGDRVLTSFGQLIKDCSRKTDLVARIGGEEFCIVLWNADLSGARLVAENLRTQFQTMKFEGIPAHKRFTSSFGVAMLRDGEDAEELYRRADKALYAAKQNGRNRVCHEPVDIETVKPLDLPITKTVA